MKVIEIYKKDLSSELEAKIATFLSDFFHTEIYDLWKLRFNLIWHSNPYLTDGVPAGWILNNDDDIICGFLGNVPVEFQYGNTILRASGTGPLYVSKKYAGIESARLCLSFIKQKTDLLITSTPNDNAMKIFTKLRLSKIPVDKITSFVIILAPYTFLKYFSDKYLRNNDRESTPYRLKKLNIFENNLQKAYQHISVIQNFEEFQSRGYCIKSIRSVPEFVNCLSKHPPDNRIMLTRTSESLNWILFSPEVQILLHRSVISIWDHVNSYLGYCIFDLKEDGASQRYLLVREIELLKFDVKMLKALKKYLKVVARQNSCFMIQIRLINPNIQLDQMLRKVILLKKDGANNYLVKLSKNTNLSLDEYHASALDPDIGFV